MFAELQLGTLATLFLSSVTFILARVMILILVTILTLPAILVCTVSSPIAALLGDDTSCETYR
ncbi:MAG TPA: hypothetical protein VLM91_09310 [Candidatus Methylomirabilis sp.]|nr:hypothetical protein [Candidatus Methylomirabilis sp.]